MDGVRRCLDNIYIERFWRTIKYEDIFLHKYENMLDASE
ncbi:MAG: transposase [Candidatus Peribacteria bacterium]|nr:MAG: transposase [Candidatus Peribacteria bacterium]